MPWLSQGDFDAKLKEFFARPDVLVIGEETASQALLRFTRAVTGIIQRPVTGDIFVFTHATVMTLFVAACTGQDAFAFWQTLGMPAFAVLTLPDLIVEETVADVGA
jgi:broad specificity phosphatase PhoE